MNRLFHTLAPAVQAPVLSAWCVLAAFDATEAATHEVHFDLKTDPDAVALQFDVTANAADAEFSGPVFTGASRHTVEFAEISAGVTRYVVYSTTGQPISPTGSVKVSFSTDQPPTAGMLSFSKIIASDAGGVLANAEPNSRPVLAASPPTHRSAEIGRPARLAANVVDLDGSISSVIFRVDGTVVGTSSGDLSEFMWTPSASGLFPVSATATAADGGWAEFALGEIQTFHMSDLTTFSAFIDVHFGTAADTSLLDFEAIPPSSGIPNGIAWLLGINPTAPDRSLLPASGIEDTGSGKYLTFRFSRIASPSGVDWRVGESTGLATWTEVPAAWVTENPAGDDRVDVEVRKPIDPDADSKGFLLLEVTETL